MRITPIVNADIIYRYRKQANTVIDAFTNQVLIKNKNNSVLDKTIKELNRVGMINAGILDNCKGAQPKLMYLDIVA
jgi:hypothetical protein